MDAADFIAVKGFKAKGKRLTTYAVERIEELIPETDEEPAAEDAAFSDESAAASGENMQHFSEEAPPLSDDPDGEKPKQGQLDLF